MANDQELIEQYLSSGGTIKVFSEAEPVFEPYKGTLIPTSKIKYDRNGKRVYQNLGKTPLMTPIDESKFNYGR
mgnify:FL=1